MNMTSAWPPFICPRCGAEVWSLEAEDGWWDESKSYEESWMCRACRDEKQARMDQLITEFGQVFHG